MRLHFLPLYENEARMSHMTAAIFALVTFGAWVCVKRTKME